MQRNALGSICFLAFLLCGVSCKNVLKPYSGNQAFKRSPRVRFIRALEDGAVPDEHLVEDLLENTKTDVSRRHISGQGDSLGGSQADALAYAQSSGLGNGLGNAQAYAESSAQGNAGPQYQYGSVDSPNQMPVISDFLVFPGHSGSQGSSQANAQANALSTGLASELGNAEANAQSKAQANVQSSGQGNHGSQHLYGSLDSYNHHNLVHSNRPVGGRPYGSGYELENSHANAQTNALSNGLGLGSAQANSQANSLSNGLGLGNAQGNAQANALSNGLGLGSAQANSHANSLSNGLGNAQGNAQENSLYNGLGLGNIQTSSESSAPVNSGSQWYLYDSLLSSDQLPYYLASPSKSGLNVGLRPDESGYGLVNSQANAQANAQSNALGLGNAQAHGLGLGAAQGNAQTNSLYNGLGNAQGNAQANALSSGLGLGAANGNAQANTLSSGLGLGYAQSHSQASALANYDTYNLGSLERLSRESDSEEFETQELSQDGISSKSGAVNEVVNPFTGGYSRTVPRSRYILPHLLPGGSEFLRCSVEGELHTAWTPLHECMVCVCLREGPYVVPHCVSCNCEKTDPVVPAPVEPLPLPPSESQVSCDPLPTDTPFQDPVNPCQVCVCSRVFNQFGKPDIQVVCQENPQCQPQPEIHPVPVPLPLPQPVPEPELQPEPEVCVGLPINVPFRHPSDACRICVCAVEVSYGVPKEKILCQPDPQCEVEPIIIPEPVEPLPSPFPVAPELYPVVPEPSPVVPEPYPVDPEPLPWPPAPAPGPLPPSPLPGPPPHQSCSPYPPNQPFQHPWDQCRVCVCYEVITANVINVEVDCFTSKLCCVEVLYPDQPNQLPALPGPSVQPVIVPQVKITYIAYRWEGCAVLSVGGSIGTTILLVSPVVCFGEKGKTVYWHRDLTSRVLDKKCQYRGLEVEFMNPSDSCTVCRCRQYGSLVLPSCRRLPRPECVFSPVPSKKIDVVYIEPRCRTQLPHQKFSVRDHLCLCESIYHYVVAKCVPRITNFVSPDSVILPPYNNGQSSQYPLLTPSNLYSGGSSAQAHAFAESNVNSLNEGYLGNSQLYLPSNVQPSPGNALAEALAHGQASGQGNVLANAQTISQGYGQANAEAEANVNSYVLNKMYPYYLSENSPFVLPRPNLNHGLLGDSIYQNSALAQGNALANAQGYGQANTEAEASANSYTSGLKDVYNPYYISANNPLVLQSPDVNHGLLGDSIYQNSALAQGNALANAQGYGQANTEAEASANSYTSGLKDVYNPYYISANNPLVLQSPDVNHGLLGDSIYQNSALAQGNALANAQGYGQANAEAEVNTNTYSNGLQGVYNPYYIGGKNPLLLPNSNLNSGFLQDLGYLNNAQSSAEAYTQANLANAQGHGQANTEAEASENSYTSGLKDVYNPYYISAKNRLVLQSPDLNHGLLGNSLYQNSAQAQANANAQGYGQANAEAEVNANTYSNGLQGVYNPYYIGGNNPLLQDLGYLNNAQSSAEAYAQASTQGHGQANAETDANSYYNGLQDNPYYFRGNNLNNAQSSAEAYAHANAQGNALTNALANLQGNDLANALAEGSANSYLSGLQDIYRPFYYRDETAQSNSAEAHSESSAEYNYGLVGAQSNQQSSAQADAYSENSAQMLGKGNLYTLYPQGNAPLNGRLNLGPLQLSAPKLYYVDKSGKSDDDLYDNEDLVSSASARSQKSLAARSLDEVSSELLGLSLRDAEDVESSEILNSPQAQALTSTRGSEGESGYAQDMQMPQGVTPIELTHLADIKDYAAFGDAEHRGPKWLDTSDQHTDSESDLKTDLMTESSSLETESESKSKSSSLGGSSVETNEEKLEKRVYRECTPCPHDMMKRHTNRGINWICARYQRARRSFKSECMMRYRNCQDGTLFVKLHENRCGNSTFHGKHWFYVYRV